jgi:hypothetical protein
LFEREREREVISQGMKEGWGQTEEVGREGEKPLL